MAKHLYLNSHTFAEPLPPAQEEVSDWLIDHGEVCEGVYDGKKPGSWYAVTASGVRICDTGWVIKNYRIDGGKIAEWWVTWDNMKILRSLGHLPSG